MPAVGLLRPADYRVMPWKNGLGTTREIAIDPFDAELDAFVWRISIADLGASGPFSTFPGYDRILVQIEGEPMTLTHEGAREHRLRRLTPYRFAGELTTHCTLDAPPARDFNVMFRRDVASADVAVHDLAEGATVRTDAAGETCLVYVLRGSAAMTAGGARATVMSGETLRATGARSLEITASPGGAVALVVTIEATRSTTGARER